MQWGAFGGRPGSGAYRAYESSAKEPGGCFSSPLGTRTPSSISALAPGVSAGEPADCTASWSQS